MEKEQKFIVDYQKQISEIEEIGLNLENGLFPITFDSSELILE